MIKYNIISSHVISIPPPIRILNAAPLKRVNSYKYLGILISSDLMWSSHISSICSKTRRLTGMLYRQFYKHSSPNTMLKLYTSFIRPHLEYVCTAWDPFLKKDVNVLEDVKEFALRVCTKSWDLTYDATRVSQTHALVPIPPFKPVSWFLLSQCD